jgi:hypothetical protein
VRVVYASCGDGARDWGRGEAEVEVECAVAKGSDENAAAKFRWETSEGAEGGEV